MAQRFLPGPDWRAPFLDYPYYEYNGELYRDPKVWKAWENGFGGIKDKLQRYRDNLLKLKGLIVDYGTRDEYKWIPQGCEYFSRQLEAQGIPHKLVSYDGGHEDQVNRRVMQYVLPFFSEILAVA
jgi:S-formylglutathione hydrolase